MSNTDQSSPSAAGALLAIAILAGAIIGMIAREPSAGVVGGAATGVVIAIFYWLRDRRRIGR